MIEIQHELLQLTFAHFPVTHRYIRLGHEFANGLCGLFDGFDGVVDEVNLTAAPNFAHGRFSNHRFVPFEDEGLHGETLRRRRRDERQIAQSAHRHVQRARYRSRRQGEHIDFGTQRLELFLVAHSKAVFFVDHDQAQVLEADLALEKTLSCDDDVDRPAGHSRDHRFSFLVGTES